MSNSYAYLLKYILIGDSSVGKSCILMQFIDKRFKGDHDTTIGVEFGSKTITVNQQPLKIQIWDTAGQESFRSITRSYYRGSICSILVYDITRLDSFNNISKWMDEIKNYGNKKIIYVLIGNKKDLANKREVSFEDGQKFANDNDMIFLETSAKEAINIDDVIQNITNIKAFYKSAEVILKQIELKHINPKDETLGIRIGPQSQLNQIKGGKIKQENCCI